MKEIDKYQDEEIKENIKKTSIINSKLINEQLLKNNSKDRELYEKVDIDLSILYIIKFLIIVIIYILIKTIIYIQSIKAFVSWVRAYNEHQVSYIFRFKNVDVALVAEAYGLLRVYIEYIFLFIDVILFLRYLNFFYYNIYIKQLPRMPELKNKNIEYKGLDIDVSIFFYG